jgi:predicted RNase H-like HicB family nuclease
MPWADIRESFNELHRRGLVQAGGRMTLVVLERDELDGGWVASFKAMPGCMSQGATEADALRNLADAIEAVRDVTPPAPTDPKRDERELERDASGREG